MTTAEKENIHATPTRSYARGVTSTITTKTFGVSLLPSHTLHSLALTEDGVKWFTDSEELHGKIALWDYIAGVFSPLDQDYFPLSHYKSLKNYEPAEFVKSNSERLTSSSSPDKCTIILRCLHVRPLPYVSPQLQQNFSYYTPPKEGKKRLTKLSNKPHLKLHDFKFQAPNEKVAQKIRKCIQTHLQFLGRRVGMRLRVYVNPVGGRRRAMKYFVRQVLPVFHAAHCVVDVIVTQHRNHAWDDIRDLTTLSHYDGIVAVSGDGLVNELVNGLMHRPSQSLAGLRQIKLGVIPAGTGNALASEMGLRTPLHAALAIIRDESRLVDLIAVYQPVNDAQLQSEAKAEIKSTPVNLSPSSSHNNEKENERKDNNEETTKPHLEHHSETTEDKTQYSKEHEKEHEQADKTVRNSQTTRRKWKLIRYGFMGLLWALLSDVDIESERWRALGALRMDLAGVLRILSLRVYRARVLYQLETDPHSLYGLHRSILTAPPVRNPELLTRQYLKCGEFSVVHLNALPVCTGPKSCPVCTTTPTTTLSSTHHQQRKHQHQRQRQRQRQRRHSKDTSLRVERIATTESPSKDLPLQRERIVADEQSALPSETLIKHHSSKHRRKPPRSTSKKQPPQTKKSSNSTTKRHRSRGSSSSPSSSSSTPHEQEVFIGLHPELRPLISFDPDHYLSTTSTQSENPTPPPLPDDWYQVEGDFTFFALVNFAHIASNANPAPYAHPHSGHLDLVYTQSRKNFKFLSAFARGTFETGAYVHKSWIHYTKVRACILEPLGPHPTKQKHSFSPLGLIDLDGELLGFGQPTAIEVHRGILNVFSFLTPHNVQTLEE